MIQQVNIIVSMDDNVAGYNNVDLEKLPQITNGYVNSIICNCTDKISKNTRNSLFMEMLKKLSPGGQITVRFLSPSLVCNKIKNGFVDGMGFAEMVDGLKSSWTETDFMTLISQLNGYQLIKLYSEDVHSVAVIEKNK
jgi:hypothetical protein